MNRVFYADRLAATKQDQDNESTNLSTHVHAKNFALVSLQSSDQVRQYILRFPKAE